MGGVAERDGQRVSGIGADGRTARKLHPHHVVDLPLVGMADTDTYARDVDDLVIRLEALHQALEETNPG